MTKTERIEELERDLEDAIERIKALENRPYIIQVTPSPPAVTTTSPNTSPYIQPWVSPYPYTICKTGYAQIYDVDTTRDWVCWN